MSKPSPSPINNSPGNDTSSSPANHSDDGEETRGLLYYLSSHLPGLQNLKPILKNIYILFCSYLGHGVNEGDYKSSDAETHLKFRLEDTTTLSSFLLNELHRRLSLSSHKASSNQDVGLTLSEKYIRGSHEEILLLLRCCCLVVCLHPHDHTLAQKFHDTVSLLRRLYLQLISSQTVKSIDSSVCLVKQMLEVYVDEVFTKRSFQECLVISDSISFPWQNQSMCSSMQIRSVLEVIAAHFLLSVSGDQALQTFLESFIWTKKSSQSRPELCLTVGLSLIKHPVVMSSPVIVHSHLISLVSEVIGMFPNKAGLNTIRSKFYLSTFYDAVILYGRHFSKLTASSCSQLFTSGKTAHRAFESLYQFEIFDKVNLVLVDMERVWRAQTGDTTSSVVTDAISYTKMNVHIIGEAYRDYVFTFMSSVISKVVSAEMNEPLLERIRAMTLQDICLLTSILKLMSCSLLQATNDSKSGFYPLELLSESKHMLFHNSPLSGITSCSLQYNLLPMKVQQLIIEGLRPGLSAYDEYKLMFLHFAGLLSLCMISGVGILVKGCLFFMLVLMNILTQKESSSDFRSRIGSVSPVHAISQATSTSTVTMSTNNTFDRKQRKISSMRAASSFHRARLSLSRHQASLDCSVISDEETCDGEAFLTCVTNNSKDIAELADFIECKQEKDYASWLVYKKKFRSTKLKKIAKQRRMRMTKVCRSLGYQGRVKL